MATTGKAELWRPDSANWLALLDRLPHDVYHRPDYHLLTGLGHQGTPQLFSYEESDGKLFLWPYLIRPIPATDNYDVSSVYGYAGPVSSPDPEFVQRAWLALGDHWRQLGVVSAFTRFHPLLDNAQLLANLPGISANEGLCPAGSTVSIDLSIPSTDQVRRYQKVLRQEIRKSRELGFVTTEDTEWEHAGTFVELYLGTMLRRNSRKEYLIDEAWLRVLRQSLGTRARLFVTKYEGRVAAALLAMEHHPFLHAHLTGINSEMAAYSPLKILLDDIREWGTQRGLQHFHLGGGLGGREDSLFQFKRRFSSNIHPFFTGRWVLDRTRYEELERGHREVLLSRGYLIDQVPQYFPIYRYHPIEADSQNGGAGD
jgi:hypothetical protein